jgi:hypothetical protein
VLGGMARQEVSMVGEKRLQIRRQKFPEAGCRAADVGLHKYGGTKRTHGAPAMKDNLAVDIARKRWRSAKETVRRRQAGN